MFHDRVYLAYRLNIAKYWKVFFERYNETSSAVVCNERADRFWGAGILSWTRPSISKSRTEGAQYHARDSGWLACRNTYHGLSKDLDAHMKSYTIGPCVLWSSRTWDKILPWFTPKSTWVGGMVSIIKIIRNVFLIRSNASSALRRRQISKQKIAGSQWTHLFTWAPDNGEYKQAFFKKGDLHLLQRTNWTELALSAETLSLSGSCSASRVCYRMYSNNAKAKLSAQSNGAQRWLKRFSGTEMSTHGHCVVHQSLASFLLK